LTDESSCGTNTKVKVTFIYSLVAASLLATAPAFATSRPLPFTYPNETLPEGQLEVEVYTDVNPLRVPASEADPTTGAIWEPSYTLQTEFEYGVTDRVELGFYQVFQAEAAAGGDNGLKFDGLKWRVRTRLAEPGEWPVDVGLYLELETMHDEISLEGKVNLQRRFDRLRFMTNLWVEESLVRPFDQKRQGRTTAFIINPTAGFVYEVTPTFQPGLEYWGRGQLAPSGDNPQDRGNTAVHHFLGPTVHLNFGRLWWSAGLYAHLNNATRTPEVGDAYGPVWFRSVLGLEL
jgi:hypothetical protein